MKKALPSPPLSPTSPPPPAYSGSEENRVEGGKGKEKEKERETEPNEKHHRQFEAQTTLPPQYPSNEDADGRSSFHVYKAPGWNCNDNIITGDDKIMIQYYLTFPNLFLGRWDMTLSYGSKTGPALLKINNRAFTKSWTISSLLDERTNIPTWTRGVFRRGGVFTKVTFDFLSIDNVTLYTWSLQRAFARVTEFTCTKKEGDQNIVVATWRVSTWTTTKKGQLIILPGHTPDTLLILASIISVDQFMREVERRA